MNTKTVLIKTLTMTVPNYGYGRSTADVDVNKQVLRT